jgi:hypothetical protein
MRSHARNGPYVSGEARRGAGENRVDDGGVAESRLPSRLSES